MGPNTSCTQIRKIYDPNISLDILKLSLFQGGYLRMRIFFLKKLCNVKIALHEVREII